MPVTATYAGIATGHSNKESARVDGRNWISVGGIRSTGLFRGAGHRTATSIAPYQGERSERFREPPGHRYRTCRTPGSDWSVPATTRSSATG